MAADTQAFTGFAGLPNLSDEWNRTQFMIQAVMNKMATTTLVQVQAVEEDGDGFKVDVQPMVSQVDGAGNAVAHGIIHDIPVLRVQGGTSALIVAPVVGDIGLAVFCSSDISGVKRAKEPTTPGSSRRYDWSDGVYIGGLLNAVATQFIRMDDDGITITAAGGGAVAINAPGGLVVTAPTASFSADVTVGGDMTTGPGSTFNGKSFDTHTHSGVTTGGGNSGPPV